MEFENKVALVTGAAGSIGKGIAQRFCQQGAKVFITDLDQTKLDQCCTEIDPSGKLCKGLAADVTNHKQVTQVVQAAIAEFGGNIDILVNVAGIVAQGRVEDIAEEDWDRVFAVNCKGTFLFIKEAVPAMKKTGAGKIINFSSKSGKTGSALMCHYSAAKGAIIALTQSLAYELAGDSINVNCICPGITENTGVWDNVSSGYVKNMNMPIDEIIGKFTAKVPLQRLARIEDIVSVTCFLASKGADYMTGQAINVTGGREMH